MNYQPKLNASRGFMIEKCQPFTKLDVKLAKQILDEKDELVIGIGSAGESHEPGMVMTAGERVDLTDYILRAEGLDPNRYIITPIENAPEATQWVSEVMMVSPKWNTFYTRNFKNASMFASFKEHYNYDIKTVEVQKPEKDFFKIISENSKNYRNALSQYIPDSAFDRLEQLNIINRTDIIYNRRNIDLNKAKKEKRALFLGGLQPFTGLYKEGNGHIVNIKLALEKKDQIIIAIGSAQDSHKDSDPLTVGRRIDVVRYALQANGVDASKFYTIPIKDISANACYSTKVVSLCPGFDSVIAGNDWTKQLFGEGNYEIIPVSRSKELGTDELISGTRVRNTISDIIKKNHSKTDPISKETVKEIESALSGMMDKATLDILNEVKFYDIMHFLAFAKE